MKSWMECPGCGALFLVQVSFGGTPLSRMQFYCGCPSEPDPGATLSPGPASEPDAPGSDSCIPEERP